VTARYRTVDVLASKMTTCGVLTMKNIKTLGLLTLALSARCALTVSVVVPAALVLAFSVAWSAPPATSVPMGADAPPTTQAPSSENSSDYIIGPGDMLQVFVWRNPDLSQTVPVRPDGKISTPLVENMVAVGKTPSQLARDLENVLSDYVRSPKVNVIVTKALGELTEVKVVGQVTHPMAVPYHEGMTVIDVILDAGGLTSMAAGNRARIVRMQNGKTEEIRVKLTNLMQKGEMSQNFHLLPGDVVVVPHTIF
jgi:polysaccharide export outer membrane protein